MEKYQNKYRVPSARAQWWDYGWNGAYYITICTKDKKHIFGEIMNSKMYLSNTGIIADIFWHEIPKHSSFVELGEFVVMPNHIHGILIFDKPDDGNNTDIVETGHALSVQQSIGQSRFQNIGSKTISSIIGSYKSAVTRHANRLCLENGWQTRFHDHIIRNYAEFQKITEYIVDNPKNWERDKLYELNN